MVVTQNMFSYCGGLRAAIVSLSTGPATIFCEAFFQFTFGFSYVIGTNVLLTFVSR